MNHKIRSFFENAKMLNEKFNIVPLMYGSLGLEYITNQNLDSDDIDILIPGQFVKNCWEMFKGELETCSFALTDEHEHTFQKDGIYFSYAEIEELEAFAGIRLADIKTVVENGALFRILSPEQYLKVYLASSKDGYRINIRKKKDSEKIDFIKSYIRKDNEK